MVELNQKNLPHKRTNKFPTFRRAAPLILLGGPLKIKGTGHPIKGTGTLQNSISFPFKYWFIPQNFFISCTPKPSVLNLFSLLIYPLIIYILILVSKWSKLHSFKCKGRILQSTKRRSITTCCDLHIQVVRASSHTSISLYISCEYLLEVSIRNN